MVQPKKKPVSNEYFIDEVKYHYNQLFGKKPTRCGSIIMYQAGEMFCDGQKLIESHRQSCFELTYIVDGEGLCLAEGKEYKVKSGDCFISLNNEDHAIISSKEYPLRFKFMAFNPVEEQQTNAQRYIDIISGYIKERRIVNLPLLNSHFLKVFEECENETTFSGEKINIEVESMLIEIIRGIQSSANKKYPLKLSDQNILIFKVVRTIDGNVEKIKNLYELAEILGYSYNHLSAVFKKVMGVSINDYFIKAKMDSARKYLTETDLSVTDIAEILNYSSIHTFTRSFKNFFGYPPCKEKRKN